MALQHYLQYDTKFISLNPNLKFSESELLKFVFLVKELKTGKPIQYILGFANFYDLTLIVNNDVLIPRQETEELLNWILTDYKNKRELNILDIGTGSGCIAIAIKKNLPYCFVQATDDSANALLVAAENARINETQITFTEDDILNPEGGKYADRYDVIVSNPPYVTGSEKYKLHQNVVDHEPHHALFVANENPLLYYDSIAGFAKKHLSESGSLYFEINENFGNEVAGMLTSKGFNDVVIRKDLNGKSRMVKARQA